MTLKNNQQCSGRWQGWCSGRSMSGSRYGCKPNVAAALRAALLAGGKPNVAAALRAALLAGGKPNVAAALRAASGRQPT